MDPEASRRGPEWERWFWVEESGGRREFWGNFFEPRAVGSGERDDVASPVPSVQSSKSEVNFPETLRSNKEVYYIHG